MMRWVLAIGLVLSSMMTAGMVAAQDKADMPCTLPQLMAAWRQPPASGADGRVGQPHRLTLVPCHGPSCKPNSHGAEFALTIDQAGRYRVAMDGMAWIDLLDGGKPLDSVLCEHSGCAPMRKIVQYDIDHPGRFIVRLDGKNAGDLTILVAPVQD